MNEQDKFECRHQEIVDAHTGVTITLGSHADGVDREGGEIRKGLRWMRIAVPHGNPDDPTIEYGKGGWRAATGETKTSTVTFGPDGQALKILPHVQAPTGYHESAPPPETEPPPSTDIESPRAAEIKEELHHLDEVEASLHHDETASQDKVDKKAKHAKK